MRTGVRPYARSLYSASHTARTASFTREKRRWRGCGRRSWHNTGAKRCYEIVVFASLTKWDRIQAAMAGRPPTILTRCAGMRRISSVSWITATTFISDPHLGQTNGSIGARALRRPSPEGAPMLSYGSLRRPRLFLMPITAQSRDPLDRRPRRIRIWR